MLALRSCLRAIKPLHKPPAALAAHLPTFGRRALSALSREREEDTRFTTAPRGTPHAQGPETEPLHVLEYRFSEKSWNTYAKMMVESRAQGNLEARTDLAFLAFAFRDFDLDKNNVLDAEEFRAALCSYMDPNVVEECFQTMDANADGKIQLDEWLDNLPKETLEKLYTHTRAESWRRLALGNGFLDR